MGLENYVYLFDFMFFFWWVMVSFVFYCKQAPAKLRCFF